ncbi:MAG: FMN-binding protein [Chitinispirillaceae bacterium]|nr:FMN-binding protein [Chitinispirillaceae bacterium]
MNDAVKMFCIVVGVTTACGTLLSGVHDFTRQRIVVQQLRYVKGPAVRAVLDHAENDPLADRIQITMGDKSVLLFPGTTGGKLTGVAIEASGQGYGGPVSVITGFDPVTGDCSAIAIAGASETPGIGSRINDPVFTRCFKGLACSTQAALRSGGGTIDGISGATISSKAVCSAVNKAQRLFLSLRDNLPEDLQ